MKVRWLLVWWMCCPFIFANIVVWWYVSAALPSLYEYEQIADHHDTQMNKLRLENEKLKKLVFSNGFDHGSNPSTKPPGVMK